MNPGWMCEVAGGDAGAAGWLSLFSIGSRPFCALPRGLPVRARRAAAGRMRAWTFKRRVGRRILEALAATGLDELIGQRRALHELPFALELAEVVEDARAVLKFQAVSVMWPSDPGRMRAYVHLLDAGGRPKGFLKAVSTRDRDALARERAALSSRELRERAPWRLPELLGGGETGNGRACWILTEALPEQLGIVTRGWLAGNGVFAMTRADPTLVPYDDRTSLSWWPALVRRLGATPPSFRDDLDRAFANGVWVTRVHGDFGRHNLGLDNAGRGWLFDWEHSSPDGPRSTDYWGNALLEDRSGIVARARAALAGDGTERDRFVQALSYRVAMGPWDPNTLVSKLVSSWDNLRS